MILCKQIKIMINAIIIISAVGFLVQYVFCDESLLSKFHQHGFKLRDVRIEVASFDHDVFDQYECIPFKYNRTTTVHNFTMRYKIDVKDKIEAVIQVYKFLSNEYRHFPIRFQVNVKEASDANAIGLKQALKCGNLTDFYFYKDITYKVCNFFIDETQFPPLIPNGKYKVDAQLLYDNKNISLLVFYCEVYTPIAYPKNPKLDKN